MDDLRASNGTISIRYILGGDRHSKEIFDAIIPYITIEDLNNVIMRKVTDDLAALNVLDKTLTAAIKDVDSVTVKFSNYLNGSVSLFLSRELNAEELKHLMSYVFITDYVYFKSSVMYALKLTPAYKLAVQRIIAYA